MSQLNIYPSSAMARLFGKGKQVKGCLPKTTDWLYQSPEEQFISVDNFIGDTSECLPIFYENIENSVNSDNKDSFIFNCPSFSLFLQHELGNETSDSIIAEAESAWLEYGSAVIGLYMTYPAQCQIRCVVEKEHANPVISKLERFLTQQNETINRLEQEISAIDTESAPINSESLSVRQAYQALLQLINNNKNSKLRSEQLELQLQQLNIEQHANKAEQELSLMQIAQLQEELEATFGELSLQKQRANEETQRSIQLEKQLAQVNESLSAAQNDNQQMNEAQATELPAELELSQLQIAQLQEELQHYFNLYSDQQHQGVYKNIKSKVDDNLSANANHSSSLALIARLLSPSAA